MYSIDEIAKICNVTTMTVRNWVSSGAITPALKDEFGSCLFSDEQFDAIKDNLPVPPQGKARRAWLDKFSVDGKTQSLRINMASPLPDPKTTHGLYANSNNEKISAILEKSNMLLFASTQRKPCNLNVLSQVMDSTQGYFDFCKEHGIVPSMRRLSNWLGYSYNTLVKNIDKQNEVGRYLDQIKDAIKDNLEQAALVNAVNNISAMFILKSQYEYVETTKVQLEPSESMLGQPKSVDEIVDYIDADIVED